MTPMRVVWEMVKYRPGRFAVAALIWLTIHTTPLLFGVFIGMTFDRLSAGLPVAETAWAPVALRDRGGRNILFWFGPPCGWSTGTNRPSSCGETCWAGS